MSLSRITIGNTPIKVQNERNAKHTDPIIYGYFPHKTYNELAISRINRTLCILLTALIFVSLVSYYFVTSSEMTLNTLGRETTKLNNENVELQNKLDNLHSYNNVDQMVRRRNILNTAKQVMEVPAAVSVNQVAMPSPTDESNAYRWSIGY